MRRDIIAAWGMAVALTAIAIYLFAVDRRTRWQRNYEQSHVAQFARLRRDDMIREEMDTNGH